MTELTVILIFAGLAYYWYNQVTALDHVRSAGKQLTNQKGWAFLDDSVIQKRIRIKPKTGKLSIYREFQFEFSDPEAKRYFGSIKHHGGVVTEIQFFHDSQIETLSVNQYQR